MLQEQEFQPLVILARTESHDQGTFGKLYTNGFSCFTVELPWRENQPNYSCVPTGEYEVELRHSPRFGYTYWVKNVQGRSYILFHVGNWAGDSKKGLRTNSNGCILPGKYKGWCKGQKAVLVSRPTVRTFMKHMKLQPFTLKIIGGF